MTETNGYDWQLLERAAQQPVRVDTDGDLARLCQYWRTLPMVALDTEFQRVDTFYPIPGLIQLADDKRCYLIDPLSIGDFAPLAALFTDESVLKVLHASSEDLELFLHSLGVLPRPLFDTQVAGAYVGWGFTMGLQRMLEHALGVQMGKAETTSDWLQRPLTQEQERYAALDVAYLPAVCLQQRQELERRGMTAWLAEEMEALLDNAVDRDPEGWRYYLRFSQMAAVPPHKMAALRDLAAWREQVCRERDVPRNRVLRNQQLLEIINRWPRNLDELTRVPELKRRVVREDGQAILEVLQRAVLEQGQRPVEPIPKPLHVIWNKRLKRLKAIARECAQQLDMAPEVLLRKRDLEALVRSRDEAGDYHLPEGLQGWRREVVAERLLAQLRQFEQ
ncbi:ribonuclease D [Marinobacterium nitratireducens]|uniref:Ribonuclease D n=1 Tax=Marinobacterium nitratireducens TaxID=518897 RepID=A0A917ZBK4_9GAMM|nr:ribonuclease D [Marinobacterium nitratireducens]GGO80345.1 ribonuclease D [Marinobacterium nitratireducens]